MKHEEQRNGLKSTGALLRAFNRTIFNGCEVALPVYTDEEQESTEVRSELLLFAVCNHELNLSPNIFFEYVKGPRQLQHKGI